MPFSLPQRSFVYAFLLHYPNDVFSMNNWLIHCITRKIKSEDILNGSNLLVCAKKKENDALFMQLLLMHGLWRSNHFENLEMLSPQSEVKINYPEVNEMVPENWIAIFHAIRAHSKKSAYDMYRSLFCLVCTHLAHFGCKAGFFFFFVLRRHIPYLTLLPCFLLLYYCGHYMGSLLRHLSWHL